MGEIVYRNLGELVEEAKKKFGYNKYPIDHKDGNVFTTGFYNVYRRKCTNYKQGFNYEYRYRDKETREWKRMCSVNIKQLHDKVMDKGYKWSINDEEKALMTAKNHDINLDDLRPICE